MEIPSRLSAPPARCAICSESQISFWHTRQGADAHSYEVYRCASCGSAFIPAPPATYLSDFYEGLIDDKLSPSERLRQLTEQELSYPNASLDSRRMIADARATGAGDKLLDIGAGYGFFTQAAQHAGFSCTAIEPSKSAGEVFAAMNGFRPVHGMFDEAFVSQHQGEFDVVLMSQVLEHLPDVSEIPRLLRRVMRPGGRVVIAVPHFGSWLSRVQGRRDIFIIPPEHLNFFSANGLVTLFEKSGFECTRLYTVSRYDPRSMRRRLKFKLVADMACALLDAFLSLADRSRKGMYLNATFKAPKSPTAT